ncbi:MAG: mevalonate kinase family protein [Candidatus Micrarchaeia archaeon]
MMVSAPTKIILFGEHYVVYGAPALSLAVDQRRVVNIEEIKPDGRERIEIVNPVYSEEGIIYPDGKYEGHKHVQMHAAIYKEIYNRTGKLNGRVFRATFLGERIFKGMGGSSALGACIALGLYTFAGESPDLEEIFRCAQIGDEIDHGGRPSGIDARTVVHGGMIKFWREFNPDRFNFKKVEISLPKDTAIIIVDTFRGKRCSTGEQVLLFAKNNGITKKPSELDEKERDRVIQPYISIYNQALAELNLNGNPEKLGELMNKNHELLRNTGMSTDTIEHAIKIIMKNGGLGAKITGAGGEGGAIIGYLYKKDLQKIMNVLKKEGYDSIELEPTNDGVRRENC